MPGTIVQLSWLSNTPSSSPKGWVDVMAIAKGSRMSNELCDRIAMGTWRARAGYLRYAVPRFIGRLRY